MVSNLIKFELFYQRKQRSLYLLSILFLLIGIVVGSKGYAPANINYDSMFQLSFNTGIMTLGVPFIAMFFAISGVIRDNKHQLEQIVYSTPVDKKQYFISRLSGVICFSIITFTPFLIGFYVGTLSPELDPDRISGFNLMNYIRTFLIFIIPNVIISSAIIFTVALLTKNNLATYLSAICIYAAYILCSMVLNSPIMAQSIPATPEGLMIASLADPFGMSAIFEQTQFWTTFQKNNQSIQLAGYLLWNRIIWLSLSGVILFVGYFSFSFRKIRNKARQKKQSKRENSPEATYSAVNTQQSFQSKVLIIITLIKSELKSVFKSLPFIGIIIVWVGMVVIENYARVVDGGEYNNSMYPTSNLLIGYFTEILTFIALILIVFYSGELVWRNKESKINEIIDSTPVSNSQLFISKLIALIGLPFILILSGILFSVCFQLYLGYEDLDISLYLSTFYFHGLRFLFYCFLAMFINHLISKKYLAMGITGILILLFGSFPESIGLEHPLFRLGISPIPSFTNMNGFIIKSEAFHHYAWYWVSFGLLLSVVAFQLLNRGYTTIKFRLTNIQWNKYNVAFTILILTSFVASAASIYYHTNIKNDYRSNAELLDQKEQYERLYKQYDSLDRLNHLSWKNYVALFPSKHRYTVKAQHVLQNKNDIPVYKVLINERTKLSNLEIQRGKLSTYDSIHGIYLFEFKNGILPGEVVKMNYTLEKSSSPFNVDRAIVENGSYITFRDFEPMLGYSSSKEIKDEYERKKRGLPIEKVKAGDEHILTSETNVEKISYETVISTEADQIAIGSGNLIKQWKINDRNYFYYKTPVKVIPSVGYFSAKYEKRVKEYNGISIELYYHPEHYQNIGLIEESVIETLDYCIKNYSSYPFDHLRIAEVPGHWPFGGFSHPGTISMVEDRLYLVDVRNTETFNLVAKRTIHEVAHQWWGGILTPKIVEGGSIFLEGFAKYTESAVMEKMYGKGASWQIAKNANDTYFKGRSFSNDPEPPVYLENNEHYLAYGKHYTVLMAVRELIGEEKMNKVMRMLIDRYHETDELKLTSLELIKELYKITPDTYHELINDWFKRIVRYDLSIDNVDITKTDNGKFRVAIKIKSDRYQLNGSGEEIKIDLNEPIPIGLFNGHPSTVKSDNDIIYYQAVDLKQGVQEIVIEVDEKPEYVVIDPYITRSDNNIYDNEILIENK
ncbi:M1 family aminopeptidase [Mangrovivirga sp. M17]|uniref:M1 family aminopeptidase n=1 Tax=Mangrovivirga halotolerans TaxID=2993936 RepID=A0ABT3RRA7_9BACT|nr:M1 family aminopeptidase [Mangrovivirga halotolerans]MCX2744136.1 M1 family aminopeptidase [Mangrovivirga halotolerans]